MKTGSKIADGQPFVIYARRSRWNDTDSIERQIKTCRGHAKGKTWLERGIYQEFASGYGDSLHKRTELVKMMDYVRLHGIKLILVACIDRLSRSVAQGAFLLDWFKSLGIIIYDVDYVTATGPEGVQPSHGWQYRRALYRRLIEAENYYHAHIEDRQGNGHDGILFRGRSAPLGFTYAGKLPARLRKDGATAELVGALFQTALKYAKELGKGTKPSSPINYSELYRKLSGDGQFREVREALVREKTRKRLDNMPSLKSLLQNPLYAGYLENGGQIRANRVHEHYISEQEYNLLNKGKCAIEIGREYQLSFVSTIACACGRGRLHKDQGRIKCPKCGYKGLAVGTLAGMVTDKLRYYQIDVESATMDHISRRLKIGLFARLLERIQASLESRDGSAAAAIDMRALKYAGGGRELLDEVRGLLKVVKQYRETEYGFLAVAWLEEYMAGEGRKFLQAYGLEMTFDNELNVLKLNAAGLEVQAAPRPKTLNEINEIVVRRANLRKEIRRLVDSAPGLKAALEYDVGFASGDFWASYYDMLLN